MGIYTKKLMGNNLPYSSELGGCFGLKFSIIFEIGEPQIFFIFSPFLYIIL